MHSINWFYLFTTLQTLTYWKQMCDQENNKVRVYGKYILANVPVMTHLKEGPHLINKSGRSFIQFTVAELYKIIPDMLDSATS